MTEKVAKTKAVRPAKKAAAPAGPVKASYFDVIKYPVITEKSTMASEHNKVTFVVCNTATKTVIKEAVQSLFKVKVLKVNTLNREGKIRQFKGIPGKSQDVKQAIITLEKGQKIDIAAGVA